VFLLGAERVVPPAGRSHLYALLEESARAGETLTQAYYAEYARIRRRLLEALLAANPGVPPSQVLAATQRLLDRALFIAFAEDRELLPGATLQKAYEHRDPYRPRPIWDNFRALFRAIDLGSPPLNVPRYNGGLFAPDSLLDEALTVPDEACEHLRRLGDYHYATPSTETAGNRTDAPIIDVDILGHIFEQSIEDLEDLRAQLEGERDTQRGPSKRRREGAFYTPKAITSFIVDRALRPTLTELFEALRLEHYERAKATPRRTQPAALLNPVAYDRESLNEPQRQALIAFWTAWLERLTTVRVLDPACGSGAFLVEAFDQLQDRYEDAIEHLVELTNQPSLFDPDRTILQQNLFGVDLNGEAVEICRLSIWIKTAKRGKVLADLNENIRVGNSVVADAGVDPRALVWVVAFPKVNTGGGFDLVVGNPPYVRADHLGPFKEHLETAYRAYDGAADLYVYFIERGLSLLRPGGRLAFIVTNKWLKAEYASPLRTLLADKLWVEELVDLGHAREVFPDADVFPSILLIRSPVNGAERPGVRAVVIPREGLRLDRLVDQVREGTFAVEPGTLTAAPWMLDPPTVAALMRKIAEAGIPLEEYLGAEPYYGLKTGFNEAFLIDASAREALVQADPTTAPLLKPYVRGQDIERWTAAWDGRYLVALRSSDNHPWAWRDAGDHAEAVFAQTFPALYRHMKAHEAKLRKRADQGRYWWELRACAYYDLFDRPKVLYQVIQFYPAYAFDTSGLYTNDKGFFLPTDDFYLLGLLNSPLMWWHNWRFLPHMKDEALNPAGVRMRLLPIARSSDQLREQITGAVEQLIAATNRRRQQIGQLHQWLRVEFGVQETGNALANPQALSFERFAAEVRKRGPGRAGLTAAAVKRLQDEFQRSTHELSAIAAVASGAEQVVAMIAAEAYGLTTADLELIMATAPPRMPGATP
jgi:methylase of polypeptide subunit release factors/phage tail protein X